MLSVFLLHYSEKRIKSNSFKRSLTGTHSLRPATERAFTACTKEHVVICAVYVIKLETVSQIHFAIGWQVQLIQRGAQVRSGRLKCSSPVALTRWWWSSLLWYTSTWSVPACPNSPAFCIQHLPGCWHCYPPVAGATTSCFTEVVTSQRQQLPADSHAGFPLAA